MFTTNKKTNNFKPEGAEFLRRLAIIIMIIGVFISVMGGIVAFSQNNYEGVIYAVVALIVTSVVYGLCINLASINMSLFKIANKTNRTDQF